MIVGGDRAVVTILVKPCCGVLPGDQCECLNPEASAVEMAQVLRERPPIVLHTGPAARAAMAQTDATHPLLVAMRAAATSRYDGKGQAR